MLKHSSDIAKSEQEELYDLARFSLIQNNVKEAIDYITAVIHLDPIVPKYHAALALVHFSSKENEKALESINKAIDLQNDKATFYDIRADIYNKLGRYSEAVDDRMFVYKLKSEQSPKVELISSSEKTVLFMFSAGPQGQGRTTTTDRGVDMFQPNSCSNNNSSVGVATSSNSNDSEKKKTPYKHAVYPRPSKPAPAPKQGGKFKKNYR